MGALVIVKALPPWFVLIFSAALMLLILFVAVTGSLQ